MRRLICSCPGPFAGVGLRRQLLFWALLVFSTSVTAQQADLSLAELRIGPHRLEVELAMTPLQRQIGLMHRRSLGEDRGMLFVFERPQILSFWMKNTLIPLDIAYIDSQGKIRDIQQMTPLSLRGHRSSVPVRYALEVDQGWFAARGIAVGAEVTLPDPIRP